VYVVQGCIGPGGGLFLGSERPIGDVFEIWLDRPRVLSENSRTDSVEYA
jgi:hypothetical protein